MFNNDTCLSKWHNSPHSLNGPLYWIERALVFFIVLTYSGLWIAILLGRAAETQSMIAPDPGPIARASWFPAYLALIGLLGLNIKKLGSASLKFWPIILLLGLAVASANWSLDPSLTQRRAIALSFSFMFGCYLAIRAPLVDTLRIIGWAWLTICILNFLLIFGAPHLGVHSELHVGAWRGFMTEKNHLGGEMARANLIFLALVYFDRKTPAGQNKKAWWLGLALTWMLILGSTSKTALIATLIPYLGFLFYSIAIRTPILGLLAFWGGLSLAGIGYAIISISPETVVALIGKDLTFTGRTGIWAIVIDLINQQKWTGYGYGAFWVTPDGPVAFIVNTLEWNVPTAHNGWLEVGLAIGYPGLILIICISLFALGKAAYLATGKHGPFVFLMLFQIILFSLSESILMQQNSHASSLFYFFTAYAFIARKVATDSQTPLLSAPHWALPPRTTKKRS
ncbi:O-antigen polymerase [Hirschia baltica ATCC 49814]|uniref:O-antigen polymerase n=2 Tax=Hirschia TaxID=2723 RepID=C6XKT9_HIRBI|nr:O-antigen polymerase [Hirschia baltica ATCC 49814]